MSRRNTRSSKNMLVVSDSDDESAGVSLTGNRASKKPRRTRSGKTPSLFLNETIDDATVDQFKNSILNEVNSFFESGKLYSVFENDSNNLDKCEKSASSKKKHDCDEFAPSTSKTKVPAASATKEGKSDELVSLVDVILTSDSDQSSATDEWVVHRRNAQELLKSVDEILGSCKDLVEDTKEELTSAEKLTSEVVQTVEPVIEQPLNVESIAESPEKKKSVKISCPICLRDDDISFGATVCGHIFCMDCLPPTIKAKKCCPICRKKITMKQFHPIFI